MSNLDHKSQTLSFHQVQYIFKVGYWFNVFFLLILLLKERNLYINNKQNKIDELIRKQSWEGSYLDKFSDATQKYLKLNIVHCKVNSNYLKSDTRNNDLNSPTNTNTYSSLDNIGTADSWLDSRNHLKENLQSKDCKNFPLNKYRFNY